MDIDTLVDKWMLTQEENAVDTSVDTDPVVMYLSYMLNDAKKYAPNNNQLGNGFWEYDISTPTYDFTGNTLILEGQAKEFLSSFQIACRKKGVKCEYRNARQLGRRIKDSEQIINDAGWKVKAERLANNSNSYRFEYVLAF